MTRTTWLRALVWTSLIVGIYRMPISSARATHARNWKFNSEAGYAAGHFRGTQVNNYGELALSRRMVPLLPHAKFSFVNAVIAGRHGTLYFGTSPRGKVYQARASKISVFYNPPAAENRVLALAEEPDGALLAALSGVRGELVRLTRVGGKVQAKIIFQNPSVQYIWAIQPLADGSILLATGPHGQLWKISPRGRAALLLKTGEHNILALAVDPKGNVIASTDGLGLVIRVNPRTGAAFVLLSAGHAEISSLAVDSRGDIFAATASPNLARLAGGIFQPQTRPHGRPASVVPAIHMPIKPKPPHGKPKGKAERFDVDGGGLSAPALATLPALPGPPATAPLNSRQIGNVVYQIRPDGRTHVLLHVPDMVLSMLYRHGVLILGTGDHGRLIFYNPFTQTESLVARLKQADILSMALNRQGRLYLGTANQGQVYRLSRRMRPAGQYISRVLDARLPAHWGAAHVVADIPHGASVTIQTRTGNVRRTAGDRRFWSPWSAPLPANTYRRISSSPARYLQYRLNLKSSPAGVSPAIRSTTIFWRRINVSPQISSAVVESVPSHPHTVTIRWRACDPDGDTLEYTLKYRQKGVPVWIGIARHLHKNHYIWKTNDVPDGYYRVKVVASDAADNPPQETRRAARETSSFLIENTPPTIARLRSKLLPGRKVLITGVAGDTLSPIVSVRFQVDSARYWRPAAASSKIFDSPLESFSALVGPLAPGPHRIAVRARDAKGNQVFRSVLVIVP